MRPGRERPGTAEGEADQGIPGGAGASMRPGRERPGTVMATSPAFPSPACFNAARARRPGNAPTRLDTGRHRLHASMRPGREGPGTGHRDRLDHCGRRASMRPGRERPGIRMCLSNAMVRRTFGSTNSRYQTAEFRFARAPDTFGELKRACKPLAHYRKRVETTTARRAITSGSGRSWRATPPSRFSKIEVGRVAGIFGQTGERAFNPGDLG